MRSLVRGHLHAAAHQNHEMSKGNDVAMQSLDTYLAFRTRSCRVLIRWRRRVRAASNTYKAQNRERERNREREGERERGKERE